MQNELERPYVVKCWTYVLEDYSTINSSYKSPEEMFDEWKNSEEGLWVAANSSNASLYTWKDLNNHSIHIAIKARMTNSNHLVWKLRYE